MNSPSAPAAPTEVRSRRRRSRPRRRWLPWGAGAVLLAALVAGFWPHAIEVEVATVGRGPLVVSVFEEGKTRIRHRYVVSAPVAGQLERVTLRAGAKITAGETLLATLTPAASPFLDPQAEAQARARVQAVDAATQARGADLERARAARDLAVKDVARAEPLHRSGALSGQEWDVVENRARVLEREVNAAEFALQVARFELAQAQAFLLQGQRATPGEAATVSLVAPVDGFVLNVFEESARVVAPGQPLLEVGDPRDLEAEIELLSTDAVAVTAGADVSIEEWGGDTPLRGRVALVEPAGYTKYSALGVEEQRVRVRVDFIDAPPPDRPLGDRYRVEARIVTWRGADVLQLPTGALFRRGGEWMTFLLRDGAARLQRVQIGHNNGTSAEVLSGLDEGATVIVHPPDSVADGSSARPVGN